MHPIDPSVCTSTVRTSFTQPTGCDLLNRWWPMPALLTQRPPDADPQLADKPAHARPAAYVCRGSACSAPVFSAADLTELLREGAPA